MPDSFNLKNSYDDIINIKWPQENASRVPMNLNQRAKIFLPFAALNGYELALENRLREVEQKMNDNTGKIQFDETGSDYCDNFLQNFP